MPKPPTSQRGAVAGRQPRPTPQPSHIVTATETKIVKSGPIPDPATLQQYDILVPGSAQRIIAMAEREQAHRHAREAEEQAADIRHRDELTAAQMENAKRVFRSDALGQTFGFIVAAGCVGGAIFNIWTGGHWSVTIAFVSLPVASIIKAIRTFGSQKDSPKR